MAFRLAKPAHLVDINEVEGLDKITSAGKQLHIGACVRHAAFHKAVTDNPLGNLLSLVVRHIAHYPIRLRGTFCGSVAHADPASEWCLVAATLDATIVAQSTRGTREILSLIHIYGGGLCTREVTLPGFYHNLHSINHFHISETPWFKDLELGERVTYITPRYEFGQAHSDGSALVLGRDLNESLANIARFSKKDAATFREWNIKAEKITREIFLPERYAEPLPQAEREALLNRTVLGLSLIHI